MVVLFTLRSEIIILSFLLPCIIIRMASTSWCTTSSATMTSQRLAANCVDGRLIFVYDCSNTTISYSFVAMRCVCIFNTLFLLNDLSWSYRVAGFRPVLSFLDLSSS